MAPTGEPLNLSTASAAELVAEVGQLDARQARLAVVKSELTRAREAWNEALAEAHRRYAAVVPSLAAEEAELLTVIATSEQARDELETRQQRVAELRAELVAAEREIPSKESR